MYAPRHVTRSPILPANALTALTSAALPDLKLWSIDSATIEVGPHPLDWWRDLLRRCRSATESGPPDTATAAQQHPVSSSLRLISLRNERAISAPIFVPHLLPVAIEWSLARNSDRQSGRATSLDNWRDC